MTKLLPLLLLTAALAFTSCIDKDYDLSKIDTDDVTIGGDDSEFRIPLATVKIDLTQLTQGGTNIAEIFKEADLWLPRPLPANAKFVDITLLFKGGAESTTYRNGLITLFFNQLTTNSEKLENLTSAIFNTPKYLNSIKEVIPTLPAQPTFEQFKLAFTTLVNDQNQQIMGKVNEFVYDYLSQQLQIDEVAFAAEGFDLDESVIDLLSKNLDKPNNSLHLYGSIKSLLPVSVAFDGARFDQTAIVFSKIEIESEAAGEIKETRVLREDLQKITQGVTIRLPAVLTKYYPETSFDTARKDQLSIDLKLVKRGSLSLDL